ncbi:MAG TPA: hypothetical protein DC064_07640, partial [Cyanobacteria bacterium UBA9273]|nr:hypothetical protein [Cyanobacteria bacterium UBA9273]
LTIVDDDTELAFSATQFSVKEDGTPVAAVTITRTGNLSGIVSATITLTNGTATSTKDYNSTPIQVSFADGETSKTIEIPILEDSIVENTETINLTLTNPTGGATIGTQKTATLQIKDNDVKLAFDATEFQVSEDGTPITEVTINRIGSREGIVTATVTPSNSTAEAGKDYDNTPITVTFADGEIVQTIVIPINNDT